MVIKPPRRRALTIFINIRSFSIGTGFILLMEYNFALKDGERFPCFCFSSKAVPNA